jgi:tetratricopeptide (TPR) repeat protein
VHRWTAPELAGRAAATDAAGLERANRQAAAYWQWRVQVWPQDRAADVHDGLEARYHLLAVGDCEDAGQVTEWICSQLHTWGAWDQEASLIHDTLTRLPAASPRQAAWIHQRGLLAQARGDYDEAARHYQRSLDIKERLGNRAGMATSFSQLGILEVDRGGPAAAGIAWHVKALAIRLQLALRQAAIDLRRLAAFRSQLGHERFTSLLAQATGDTELTEAVTSLLDQLDAAKTEGT